MRVLTKALALAAMSAGMLVATAPAQAAVINVALSAPPGPYNLGNPLGTIVANKPLGYAVNRNTPNTYNFTFTINSVIANLHTEMGAFGKPKVNNVCCAVTNEVIQYTLWFGLPGSGSLIGSSSSGTTAVLDLANVAAGNYFMQIGPADLARNEEFVIGGIELTAVPEPATWAMMILGVGMLGLAARRRRSLVAA